MLKLIYASGGWNVTGHIFCVILWKIATFRCVKIMCGLQYITIGTHLWPHFYASSCSWVVRLIVSRTLDGTTWSQAVRTLLHVIVFLVGLHVTPRSRYTGPNLGTVEDLENRIPEGTSNTKYYLYNKLNTHPML